MASESHRSEGGGSALPHRANKTAMEAAFLCLCYCHNLSTRIFTPVGPSHICAITFPLY